MSIYEPRFDERGFFARAWCRREFEEHGLDPSVAQANVSVSARRGTSGLHYQVHSVRGSEVRSLYPSARSGTDRGPASDSAIVYSSGLDWS